jgi:branched-chain amino acid transport system substrate-binding protein
MAQAIFGLKAAYEKAQAGGKAAPSQEQIIVAFEHLTFEGPGGKVTMGLGKGHQAVQGTAYGTVKHVGNKFTLTNVTTYTADRVTPPDGVKSEDWIKGLKADK